MIKKFVASVEEALAGVTDGMRLAIGGFGGAGMPAHLVETLARRPVRDLTVVSNNSGQGEVGIAALLKAGRVRKIICSYPRMAGSYVFEELYKAGRIELEIVPQGTLVERLRAAGSGIGGFFTRTAAGTLLAEGKEERVIDGHRYVFEEPLSVDIALIKADRADRWGNLTYRKTARNFNPIMATAAKHTIAEVNQTVALGSIDPEHVVTPGIFVRQVVPVSLFTQEAVQ